MSNRFTRDGRAFRLHMHRENLLDTSLLIILIFREVQWPFLATASQRQGQNKRGQGAARQYSHIETIPKVADGENTLPPTTAICYGSAPAQLLPVCTKNISMSDESNAVVLEPPETPTATVIWLHGLGADGHDFEAIVPQLGAALTANTRFVFPHAPHQPVTINGGMIMRAWYDIREADFPGQADEVGIRLSEATLRGYIKREVEAGITTERIVLAGFSQGGVIVLRTGLLYPEPLGGIMALSTYMPLQPQTAEEKHAANCHVPIFLAHGTLDPLIPIEAAEASRTFLVEHDYEVAWHQYQMNHSVCAEELDDIRAWLGAILR